MKFRISVIKHNQSRSLHKTWTIKEVKQAFSLGGVTLEQSSASIILEGYIEGTAEECLAQRKKLDARLSTTNRNLYFYRWEKIHD